MEVNDKDEIFVLALPITLLQLIDGCREPWGEYSLSSLLEKLTEEAVKILGSVNEDINLDNSAINMIASSGTDESVEYIHQVLTDIRHKIMDTLYDTDLRNRTVYVQSFTRRTINICVYDIRIG